MNTTPHILANGPLLQDWTETELITGNDDWSRVPAIVGYLGQNLTATTGVDPQTVTAPSSAADDVDVIADQTSTTISNGGIAEFEIANPTVALQGSGTADAPHLVLHLDATGRENVVVAFNARDLDDSADDAIQPLAVQYRTSPDEAWTNLPAGAVADASTGPNRATQVTPVRITLPAESDGQAGLEVRILTTNAVGSDEWIGIDDIAVTSDSAAPTLPPAEGTLVFDAAPSLQGTPGDAPAATGALQLVRLGAYATTDDAGTPAAANAEVVAYDASTGRLYVQNTNENRIEIVTIDAAGGLTKAGEILLSGLDQYGAVNSVAVFDGLVAVAYANASGDQPGRVVLFDGTGAFLNALTVGVGPDQAVFTGDGQKILVANEGEPFSATVNPVGSVSIIDVSGGPATARVTATVGFEGLNGTEDALRDKGLAIKPGNSAAADIEPEYIAISPDNRFAFVTLQEVNGVAVIDLTHPGTAPIAIQPLGAVDRSLPGNEFDASDRDGIRIAATPEGTPIYGLLQPDAIASYTVGGATYFVTANEGDQRVIGGEDDEGDVARLSAVPDASLTPELQALKADPAYARLNVLLRVGDTDGDGVIDRLHTLGGRGISIFRQNDDGTLTKVRETGGEFEKIFAGLAPERFNNDQTVEDTFDNRSDNKGPEPEGLTIGAVNGRTYAFVGLERQGGILVYDVTEPETANFVSYVPPLADALADLGPEVLTFLAADRNPTGTPLVISANEVEGGGATLYAALPAGFTQEVGFAPGSLSVTRAEGDAGTTSFTFTVQRTNGTLGTVAFTANLAGSGADPADSADFTGSPSLPLTINGTIPAGAASAEIRVSVQGDTLPEANETFTLALTGATSDQAGVSAAIGTANGRAIGTIVSDEPILISTVQGEGTRSPFAPETGNGQGAFVTVEAIVVGDFQNGDGDTRRNLGGFYLQEEAADQDGNALTSEGVFVYEGTGDRLVDVAEGDIVRVTGRVSEFNGETQISVADAAGIRIVRAGALTAQEVKAQAVEVPLPASGTLGSGTTAQPDLERYEGMLVTLPETLTITEQFNLDRFNEIRLSQGGRPEAFTNAFEPDAAGYAAHLAQVAARSIVYDDGANTQNLPIENLDGFGPDYGTATAYRMGDTVTGLTGVLGFGPAGAYRVRAIDEGDNTFVRDNPRPAAPEDVGGSLKVGSLNVLNYFRTLDADGATTAVGLEPRGADSAAEFARQTEKLVTTLIGTGADVLGLIEIENQFQAGNPGNAIEYLVEQLNARAGAGTYAYVHPGDRLEDGQFLGRDAIAVGYVYKPSKVGVALNTTIETLDDADVAALDPTLLQRSTVGGIFDGANTSRAALAVTFNEIATGETFTAVVNHFKSKSGTGTGADADQGDGQGHWQQQRELAAEALSEWIATDPTGSSDADVLLLGDFNAYTKEDALDILKAGGFTNLAEDRLVNPYSYVFDASFGSLDHALASGSLDGQVTGVTEWHINADEADAIDYNLDFGRDPGYFDGTVPVRQSDHDPIIVGLSLDGTGPRLVGTAPADNATGVAPGAPIVLTFDEVVRIGTGTLTLTDGAGDTRTIAVTDATQVTVDGTTVTIDPAADLVGGRTYDVLIPSGAFTDVAGNAFAGLPADALDFTTQDTPPMSYTLQILHASDWEGGLLATQRAANFAAIVDALEETAANSITLSTGDGWIPSPFYIAGADPQLAATYNGVYNQFYGLSGADAYTRLAASPGRADITIQNIIGVRAAVFGNHEFDAGPTEVRNILGANLGAAPGAADDTWLGAQFPYLSVNLNFSADTGSSGLADLVGPDGQTADFAATGPTSTQTGTGADKIAKSTILVENGEKIGFIGATTQIEPLITSLGRVTVEGFSGQDNIPLLAEQINAEVDRLLAANPDLNKIVVGTHLQQLANEQALAPLLRNVDVLIGGGSHALLADGDDRLLPGDTAAGAYPQFYTNATGQTLVLVNTASEYAYVGRLNVTFDADGNVIRESIDPALNGAVAVDETTVTELYGSLEAAFAPGTKGNLVRQVIEGVDVDNDGVQETVGVADIIRQQDGNILGRSDVYLEGRRGEIRTEETNLGNLTADANLWYARQFDANVTVSIKNGGGIRDSIGSFSTAGGTTAELPPAANPEAGKQAGDISQLDVTNSLRFNNTLSLVTLTAAELERVLEHGVAAVAPGATPGQFAQIGGISYAFDATQQSQALDTNGNVTREGQRIVSAALIDENGYLIDTLVENGQLAGDANREIRVVTLDFLATASGAAPGLGGDNYPFPAYGENKVDLRTATPVSLPDTETFAAQGSEQDALAEYLKAFFVTTPFGNADTAPSEDLRIQNLAQRADTVLDRGVSRTGTSGDDVVSGTAFDDLLRGGAGNDTLVYGTALSEVTVTRAGAVTVLEGPQGRDLVSGFEVFQFSDVTVTLGDGLPLVDDLFYLAANRDVLAAGVDPDAHYANGGWREGRDPNALFDTERYLATNPDVDAAGIDPLAHYANGGWREGRDPGADFDTERYLLANPDVEAAGIDPLSHYLASGQAEGRPAYDAIGRGETIGAGSPQGSFDAAYYLLSNADVAAAARSEGGDPFAFALTHYGNGGYLEARDPNAFFDADGYLGAYADVAAAGIDPLAHYDNGGWREGRDPSGTFDTDTYLAAYADVAAVGINPLRHFLAGGIYEGRMDFGDGGFN